MANRTRRSEALGVLDFFYARRYLSNCQTGATRGDTIALDMLCDVTAVYAHTQVVLLVDEATVRILRTWTFQTSPDGREWVSYY
jgi:hypothetical protein